MNKPSILTLIVLIAVSSLTADGIPGGRTKVKDVRTNTEVQELGRYSVEEYNRLRRAGGGGVGGELEFSEVVEAEKQVVSGLKYYLKVAAVSTGGEREVFEAVVVVKPWMRSKQLLNFAPAAGDGVYFGGSRRFGRV